MVQNRVAEQQFEMAAFDWLAEGAYTPNDIFEQIVTEHNLMLFPVHHFRLKYAGVATASLGYDRKEVHYVWNEHIKRQEKKTRTVTDWRPHSQPVFGQTTATVYAGDARFDFMRSFIEGSGWQTHDLKMVSDEASRDDKLLALFQMAPATAWEQHGANQAHQEARRDVVRSFPSSKVRNLNLNIEMDIEHYATVILPFWVFMYKYKGQPYYVALDGNNPSRVDGIRPKDEKRKGVVKGIRIMGYWIAIILLIIGIAASDGLEEFGPLFGYFMLFIFAIIITEMIVRSVKRKAKNKRKAILAQIRAKQQFA